jgi:hypothetical protein
LAQGGLSEDAFAEAGVFTADGNGNLTNIIDEFAQSGSFFPAKGAPISGRYFINKDGSGQLQFNFGGNQFTNFQIALTDSSHFSLIEQDVFATGSGSGEKQDTSAFNAVPTGTFIFQARTAQDNSFFGRARVGSAAITSGAITGVEDVLAAFGAVNPRVPFTGTVVDAPDATGLGEITLSDGTFFRYYVVNAGKFRFLSTSGSLELGLAEAQTGAPFSNATLTAGSSYVFGSSGDSDLQSGIHSAGVVTVEGNGAVTGGSVDLDFDGTISANITVENSSNYSVDPDGRGVLNLDLSAGPSKQDVFWIVNPSRAFLLVNSNAGVEDGTMAKQQGAPFSNVSLNKQTAFFMDGFDLTFKDRVGTITPDGNGNFKWSQQANSFDPASETGFPSSFSTTGTNQVGSNGRVTVTVNGLLNPGNSSLVLYMVTNNTGFVVAEDPGFDLGGAFTVQTGP